MGFRWPGLSLLERGNPLGMKGNWERLARRLRDRWREMGGGLAEPPDGVATRVARGAQLRHTARIISRCFVADHSEKGGVRVPAVRPIGT